MSRIIDADKIDLRVPYSVDGNGEILVPLSAVKQAIAMTPTEDVEKVMHGWWKWETKIEPQAQNRLYCSVCDNECLSKGIYYVQSKYCPHCGAKMDGGKEQT